MRKGFVAATVMAVLVLAMVGVFTLRDATPVSAQQVLERSYAAQQASAGSQNIQHTRNEVYQNMRLVPLEKTANAAESKTIIECYVDPQTGRQHSVVTDAATGQIISVFALDGRYVYNSAVGESVMSLKVYRSEQPGATQVLKGGMPRGGAGDLYSQFEEIRKSPDIQFVGRQVWQDGRQVYALRADPRIRNVPNGVKSAKELEGMVSTIYFDATTYRLLESRQTIERDGKEVVVFYNRELLSESLPSMTPVAWDLSDLNGITIVDDPEAEHTDRFMEPVSASELATRYNSAYMLNTAPDGFTMQLSAPFKPAQGEEGVYMVEYRDQAGDYVVLQGGAPVARSLGDAADEVYETASGLTLHFLGERQAAAAGEKQCWMAIVEAPNGASFTFTSNLPFDQVKALAEELVLVK